MILTNLETVPGKTVVEHFGIVSGSTVRAKHIGKDIWASFKNIVGGEMKGYTELLQESRDEATNRMIQQAKQLDEDNPTIKYILFHLFTALKKKTGDKISELP